MSAKAKFWLAGLLLAAIGVVLARVVAQQYSDPVPKLVIFGVGTILALGGLAVIMVGINRGLKQK